LFTDYKHKEKFGETMNPAEEEDEKKVCCTWKEMNKFVIIPDDNKKLAWDFFANIVYISSIFMVSTNSAYHMLTYHEYYRYDFFFDCVIFVDMCLYFFTAFDNEFGDENDLYNKNLKEIIPHYLTTYFVYDAIAILPVFIFEIVMLFFLS